MTSPDVCRCILTPMQGAHTHLTETPSDYVHPVLTSSSSSPPRVQGLFFTPHGSVVMEQKEK